MRGRLQVNIYDGTPYTADYEFAGKKRLELLKKAFLNINDELAMQIKEFEINNSWLTDYSVFMAVKEEENMKLGGNGANETRPLF